MQYTDYIDLKIEELKKMDKLFLVYAPFSFKNMSNEVVSPIIKMLEKHKEMVKADTTPEPF